MRQTSVLVPPISQVIRLRVPSSVPSRTAAATPPAGPESTVLMGRRAARSAVETPPLEVMMNTCPSYPRSASLSLRMVR